MKKFYFTALLAISFCNLILLQAKSIKKESIDNIQIVYDSNQVIIPGREIKLGIDIDIEGGEKRSTRGLTKGNVGWRHFNVECEGANFSFGKLYIPYDDHVIHKGEIYLKISIKKKPGIKTVKVIPLNFETEVRIYPVYDFRKSPGEMVQLKFVSYFDNGRSLEASAFPHSQLIFNHYTVETTGGSFGNGSLYIFDDIDRIDNHLVGLRVTPRTNPDITSSFEFLLDYKNAFSFVTNAPNGLNGNDGWNGSHGIEGRNGEHGENGCSGEYGELGHDIEVFVDCYYDTILNNRLLKIFTKDMQTGYSRRFYVNTSGGSINLVSRGGNGGRGGYGGQGGNGGDGRDGVKEIVKEKINDSITIEKIIIHAGERGGNGGDAGNGGFGGDGGFGGNIYINFTHEAEPYLKVVSPLSIPGQGGEGGRGGVAGTPGKGGNGNPNGRSGRGGHYGEPGENGYSGRPGKIEYYLVNEIAW